jgi:hypothetical protein
MKPHRGGHTHRRHHRVAAPTTDVIRRLAITTTRETVRRAATIDVMLPLVEAIALHMAVVVGSLDVAVVVIGILVMIGGIGGTTGEMTGGGITIDSCKLEL